MIRRKKKTPEQIAESKSHIEKRNAFFMEIWKRRKHYCQSCSVRLGNEPKSYMFDHLIEKSKRKDLEFEEDNIYLCCFQCHEKKTNGHPTEKHKIAIELAKEKYEHYK